MASEKSSSKSPLEIPLGDVSTLGLDNKLRLPKALLNTTQWALDASPIPLVAELVDEGLVRLHLASDAQPKIDALLGQLSPADTEEAEQISAIRDRYRPVQLYTANGENRVRLVPAVVAYLALEPRDQR